MDYARYDLYTELRKLRQGKKTKASAAGLLAFMAEDLQTMCKEHKVFSDLTVQSDELSRFFDL